MTDLCLDPPWSVQNPPGQSLTEAGQVQVAVVGAGPAGLAVARSLSEGAKVAVLEAGRVPTFGAAQGDGCAIPAMAEHYGPLCDALGRSQTRLWWNLAVAGCRALQSELEGLEGVPWRRGGVLLTAAVPAETEEMTRGLRALVEDGFEARMMGPAAATNYAPVAGLDSALFLPGALCFDPAQLQAALLSDLGRRGVQVYTDSPVTALELVGDGVRLTTPEAELRCEMVVVAAGPGCVGLLGLERRLLPIRGQALLSDQVREVPRLATPVVGCNRGHEAYRELGDRHMLIAGINPESGLAQATTDPVVDRRFGTFLKQLAEQRFPEVARVQAIRQWPILHTYSVDGLPLIGPLPGHSRVHIVAGFAGRSWSLGYGAGRALGQCILGKTAELPALAGPRRLLR